MPPEIINIYSVDENFVNLTGTAKLWGPSEKTAKKIQKALYDGS
ncbi:hypothetical protein [Lysinibacillus sphaericus]|nr:hypothetical protein [Lysinibacillus sphaericus]